MKIAGREIGPGHPPYCIAELSANHCGDVNRLFLQMGMAAASGADAIKLQCYTPDTITLDCNNPDFIVKEGPWKGRKLYELYSRTQTPFEWFPRIYESAKYYGLTVIVSVFDKTSVDLLEKLGCPAYKIASFEIVDTPLIKYAAKTSKPLIISTGMASDEEIYDASFVADIGQTRKDIAFLACVSSYPANASDPGLSRLKFLQQYAFESGISDHTLGWEVPVAATALGASIIEKHFTDSRNNGSEDAAFSLEPDEFADMCRKVRQIWQAMQPSEAKSEESSRQLRRSLYVVADMATGEPFTEQNVRSIRPAYGLPPKNLPNILGRRAIKDIKRGTALSWGLVDHRFSSLEEAAALDMPS